VRKYLVGIYFLFIIRLLQGQDPQFTQFYANPLYLAPSFAGATQQDRVSMQGTFVTFTCAYDHFFESFNSGVGVLILRDVAGSGNLSLTNAAFQYSYDIKINNWWHVRPGAQVVYTQQGIDYAQLIWNTQLNQSGTIGPGTEAPPLETASAVDFGTSALAYSDMFWFGFSVDHLLRPDYGLWYADARWPIKVSVFGGAQIIHKGRLLSPIDESLSLAFNFRHQYLYNQLDLGLYWYKAPLMLGFWYRGIPFISNDKKGDALAFLVGYKMDQVRVGYSYDFTISNLVSSTGGAHEISVVYEFKTTRKRLKRRMVPCPEF